jgi:ribosomal 50S subunit-recycling heat shock protein
MRLDKYLKISRIIKRRTVANEACDAQHVTVNGRDAKASYNVKIGDEIEVTFGSKKLKFRVKDIKETTESFDVVAIETMLAHKIQFASIRNGIQNAIENNNIVDINSKLIELASFINVDLGYNSQEEFVEKFDDMEIAL